MSRVGPAIAVECHGCSFNRNERYVMQGDTGRDVFCTEPSVAEPNGGDKYIGDTNWTTPEWCPFRIDALENITNAARAAKESK